MAMNSALLGKSISDLIISPDAPADMRAKIEKQWVDIANAIITHIQANAEVAAGIPVATAGTQSAQTGATTGIGKIL